MKQVCINIYKIARNNTSLTQSESAERIYISTRSVADYESGKTIPPDDVVIKMIELYKTEWLAYEHLRNSNLVGKRYLPKIIYTDIARSVLRLQKEVSDLEGINRDMIDIACDGIIHSHQVDRWSEVTKEIEEVAAAALSLVFTQNKKTSPDANLEEIYL